jgi:hypothetical protein
LLFTATVTPYEIALLEPKFDALFILNRLVDAVFVMDIIVQFITMKEKNSQSLARGTTWVTSPKTIARNYFFSWFFLDVFSIAVSAFDVYAVMMKQERSKLTVLKTMRVLRLFKLMRLIRSSRIAKRWETRIAIDCAPPPPPPPPPLLPPLQPPQMGRAPRTTALRPPFRCEGAAGRGRVGQRGRSTDHERCARRAIASAAPEACPLALASSCGVLHRL